MRSLISILMIVSELGRVTVTGHSISYRSSGEGKQLAERDAHDEMYRQCEAAGYSDVYVAKYDGYRCLLVSTREETYWECSVDGTGWCIHYDDDAVAPGVLSHPHEGAEVDQ